jgi:pyruvate dehydrogenase E2 component (dihydrolipoamide acetyltransferase)
MAPYEYILPELGEGIESGDVVQILVTVGDTLSKDQPILELETDKAVIEVPAPVDGVIQSIHIEEGGKASVGQLIVTMETAAVEAAPEAPRRDVDVSAPEAEGATETVPAEAATETVPAEAPPAAAETPPPPLEPPLPKQSLAAAAPSVRRLAREIGVDIDQVPGSGRSRRIAAEDVKNYARQLLTKAAGASLTSVPATVELPDFTRWGEVERGPMTNVRRKTAEAMAQAWSTIPHVTQFGKADITELEALRQRYAPRAEAVGGKLTITAIILKAVAAALKRFPQFNASLDMARQEIVYKKYYHIGVAVDTERGLLVPVIRDVDRKSLLELCVELTQVAETARNRKLGLEDMQGGTFTVTNLGGIGGTNFSPIINPPEVAILGLARSSIEAVHGDGQFQPRLMLPLALSYDHRLIDGADAARWVQWLADALQEPFLITLEG